MIESARQALAFTEGTANHGCEVHVPENIDVKAIREKIALSQSEFCSALRLKQTDTGTLGAWPSRADRPARAFLTVIAREPDAVRRALIA